MMLCYKAWRESLTRFLVSVAALSVLCVGLTVLAHWEFPSPRYPNTPYTDLIWGGFYSNLGPVLFLGAVILLGLGGLQRERSAGTALFTLTLPVSRVRLVLTRAAVGLLEVVVLAAIPALLLAAFSPVFVGQSYPLAPALRCALIFAGWGALLFSVAFLVSGVLPGDFTSVTLLFVGLTLYRALADSQFPHMPWLNPFPMMSGWGMPYFDYDTRLVVGPLPWTALLCLAAGSVILIAVSVRVAVRQEF